MSDFRKNFKKVNGVKVLKDYARSHVLGYALLMTLCEGFSKKSLELVRASVSNKIVKRLRKKYTSFIEEWKKGDAERKNLPHEHSNKVWTCWLQGVEDAPDIIKKCYQSLLDNLTDRDIVLLTEDNYRDWVTFPEYIQEKIDNGTISKVHMTDLLRLELLEKYGGTWIDITVFCSGKNIPDYIWDSELFIYQIMKPGLDGHAARISTWFMTAYTNHPIILLVKQLLLEYWRTHNKVVDYFLLHDLVELGIEAYPEEWMKVIPVSSSIPHILLLRFAEQYNEKVWNEVKEMTPFHKLSWKFSDEQRVKMQKPDSFYRIVMRT